MSNEPEQVEQACMAVLDRFMAALNEHDADAMDRAMHFPHIRHAESKLTIYEAPGSNPMDLFKRLEQEDGWKWSAWIRRTMVQNSDVKAHFMVSYARYRADDSEIGRYDSLYTLTLMDGRWGIQMRSSFGP